MKDDRLEEIREAFDSEEPGDGSPSTLRWVERARYLLAKLDEANEKLEQKGRRLFELTREKIKLERVADAAVDLNQFLPKGYAGIPVSNLRIALRDAGKLEG